MHLVSNPEKYQEALRRKIPFFHTACGGAEPMALLTTDPRLVTCIACGALIAKALPAPSSVAPPVAVPPVSSVSLSADADDLDEMEEAEANFGEDALGTQGPEVVGQGELVGPPEHASGASVSPFAALQPLLDSLFVGFDPDPIWERWTMTPEDDPQGSEGMLVGGYDPREILESDQAAFLTSLSQMSKVAGLEGIASRVLTLLHQVVISGLDVEGSGDEPEELEGSDNGSNGSPSTALQPVTEPGVESEAEQRGG